jgi:2-polyprenyl-6-methoxyphenol hydroxylase-like FAD-dependent oxidoreductase
VSSKPLAKFGQVLECDHGKPVGSLNVTKSRLTCGDRKSGHMTVNGSDAITNWGLAASIFGKIEGDVETIFGDSVDHIEQTPRAAQVTFASGATREFDLVVGADGLHSRVRELVFGPESRFEKYLGYKAAAFGVKGYRPRDELVYMMYTQVGPADWAVRDAR